MDLHKWLLMMIQFLVLFPAAVFCYLPMKNQLKYTRLRLFLICAVLFILYTPAASWFAMYLDLDVNVVLLPSLVIFFFLYYKTVKTDLARTLAVFLNACAVMSFPLHLSLMPPCIPHQVLPIFPLKQEHFSLLPLYYWFLLWLSPCTAISAGCWTT